jgi:hypothetical protein
LIKAGLTRLLSDVGEGVHCLRGSFYFACFDNDDKSVAPGDAPSADDLWRERGIASQFPRLTGRSGDIGNG